MCIRDSLCYLKIFNFFTLIDRERAMAGRIEGMLWALAAALGLATAAGAAEAPRAGGTAIVLSLIHI